ncbi:MAG: transcriptional repressor LexA [Planctomycetota bacterium]
MYFTKKQLHIINFIKNFKEEKGISPTLEEIAQYFNVSKITIYEHIAALEKKGALRKSKNRARSIELISSEEREAASRFKVPVLGTIAAGSPICAIENSEEFDLGSLFPDNKECYLLRVNGDSMIDDQIRDGDLVLVEKRETPENGEIVVAILNDNEATLKRFFKENDHIRLQPANANMEPIFAEDVEIRGVVIGVLRKF